MKILLIQPPEESSHHARSGRTSPAMANAQYQRRVMLPRRVHNGLGAGRKLDGFALDAAILATLMSTLEKSPFAFIPPAYSQEACHRAQRPQSHEAATDSAPQ
jgi:hypothetical protein